MRSEALVTGLHSNLTEHDSSFKQIDLPLAGFESDKILHFITILVNCPDVERAMHQELAQFPDIILWGRQIYMKRSCYIA